MICTGCKSDVKRLSLVARRALRKDAVTILEQWCPDCMAQMFEADTHFPLTQPSNDAIVVQAVGGKHGINGIHEASSRVATAERG